VNKNTISVISNFVPFRMVAPKVSGLEGIVKEALHIRYFFASG
jgi:hypothetical protein